MMEMPEGLKRFEKLYANSIDRENNTLTVQALDFMKEMAEALATEEQAYLNAKMPKNQVSPVLKKFKEWK